MIAPAGGTSLGTEDRLLLRMRGLEKSYAAPVLRGIDLDLYAGEVHALVGANGAGKSTLAGILAGLKPPDGGSLELLGRPYAPEVKAVAERAGVQLVLQELRLLPTLSVAENLYLDRLPGRYGWIDFRRLYRRARADLAEVGLGDLDPATLAGGLGVGEQQLVEIASALARRCVLLILDEPTSALTDPQVDLLFDRIKRLKEEGTGVLYISHRLDELRRIADRTTVLRDGRIVTTRPIEELPPEELVRQMAGSQAAKLEPSKKRRPGPVALRVEGLRAVRVEGVGFEVRRGEILGLAGLVGAGRTETLRAIYGADARAGGAIFLGGGEEAEPVRIERPSQAVAVGIGLVPEDRKKDGLLLSLPVRVNLSLAHLARVSRRGWLDLDAEATLTRTLLADLDTDFASTEQPAGELSGGNQQKLMLARWLLRDCPVLLLDEPTRGVDVAARRTVHRLLDGLAAQGKALVVVSSDLDELQEICDRIAVLSLGRLVRTFERREFSRDTLLAAAMSGHLERSYDARVESRASAN